MPQARSGGSRSTSGAKGTTGRSTPKRSTSASSGRASASKSSSTGARSTRSSAGAKSTGTKSTGAKAASGAKTAAAQAEARYEQAAQRVRKLNERIIEAGKEAGETTLTSYEKALRAIAGAIERGPGSSEVDWISNLATAQAKFIRDVTAAWTTAARNALK